MSTIVLKTVKRNTQVSRLKVRAAIAAVYSKKIKDNTEMKNAIHNASKSEPMKFAKASKK